MYVKCCIFVSILLVLFSPSVLAQRIFATIDAEEIDESLRFDVNNIPVDQNTKEYASSGVSSSSVDLNYSPNIVISNDSSKAFVSFSGADTILAFDPHSGEILSLIEIDANPTQIVMSPDGSKLAVTALHLNDNLPSPQKPSSFVATLAVINVESLAVKSVVLNEVLLSFANNAVFSPDGNFIYVPSMATDELIRLNSDTLEESGSRLAFTPGSRPATMTVSPDGATAAIVLIGSPSLSRIENPDSVALVDLQNYQLIQTIAPATGEGTAPDEDSPDLLLHDFGATNTFTFSDDGRFGIISDVAFSSISIAPELSFDRAWLYDFDREEFMTHVDYPGIATVSFFSPMTREFVVMGTFNLTILNPYAIREAIDNEETIPQRGITPTRSNFRPRTRGIFDPFEPLMYLTAPLRDSLLVINLETDEIKGIDVGTKVERTILSEISEDEFLETDVIYPAAPMEVALTPDNQVLAVLNFNANTIDLLQSTESNFLPGTHLDPEFFVGLAVSNPLDVPVESVMTGYSLSGLVLSDNPDTEDLIEYVNPAEFELPAKGQLAKTVEELLQVRRKSPAPGGGNEGEDEEMEVDADDDIVSAWVHLENLEDEPASLYFYGDYDLNRLDGAAGHTKTYQKAIFPYFKTDEGWATELFVVNPNISSVEVNVALYDSQGILIELESKTLPARFLFKSFVKDPDPDTFGDLGIFSDSVFEPCDEGSSGNEDEDQNFDEEDNDVARHCGFKEGFIMLLVPAKDTTDEDFLLPDGGFVAWTRYYNDEKMAVVNGIQVPWNSEYEAPAETLYQPIVLGDPSTDAYINLANPSALRMELNLTLHRDGQSPISTALELKSAHSVRQKLTDLFEELDETSQFSGWLQLESNIEGIAATIEMEFPRSITAVPFINLGSNRLIFSHQASSGGISTGLALVNPAAEASNVTLRLFSPAGELLDSSQIFIESQSRISKLVNELFTTPDLNIGGFIEVESDQPLAGIETLFRNDLEALAAIVAQ